LSVVVDGESPRTTRFCKAYVGPRLTSLLKQFSEKPVLLDRIS